MQYEVTRDPAIIRGIVTHPRLWPHLIDDDSPEPADWKPDSDRHCYVLVHDGEECLGLFAFSLHNAVCWEVHTALLPVAWGKRAAEASRGVVEWAFANTRCRRLITNVPVHNRLALHFAERAGMTQYGLNPLSFLKDGALHDQILLGVSKPPCHS